MSRKAYGIAAILIALGELLLCFVGPIAFLRKPSLVLFPLLSAGVEEAEISRLTELLERTLAGTNSYSVVSQHFLSDYFARTDPTFDRARLKPVDYNEALSISRELGLERFAIAVAFGSRTAFELSVTIRDARDGEALRSARFLSDSLESLLNGVDATGEPIDIAKDLTIETRGMGLTDWLVLALLGFQLAVGVYALLGGRPHMLVEAVWIPALILFLFAYVHARSANMDYVQRFIASGGQLRLARNTTLEQLYAALRFGPLLLLGLVTYVAERVGSTREAAAASADRLSGFAARWALPAVILSACMWSFSFPSVLALDGIGGLAWLSLTPLLLVIKGSPPARAIFYGVAFGALQALIVNYWHGTYSYVTLHVIIIVLLIEYLAFMLVLVPLVKLTGRWGFVAVPAAWVGFDYLRSIGLLGYPWGIIGTATYRLLPLIQIASVAGVWGVDFVVLLAGACSAWAADAASEALYPRLPQGRRGLAASVWILARAPTFALPVACLALVLASSLGGGSLILSRLSSRLSAGAEVPEATVLLVQQNADPRKAEYSENLQKLTALTDQALAASPHAVDLVVWPEGGFPVDIRYSLRPDMEGSSWEELTASFLAYQACMGTWLLTGEQDHMVVRSAAGEEKIRNFNSSLLLDPENRIVAIYHKRHLVPFTERFPLDKQRFAALYQLFQKFDISDWEVGTERLVYEHDKLRFFTPICFEDLFSDEMRLFVLQGADAIINISNDYWSLSPVEGRQHGLHALFRAVENQRPLLRATVSGYTVAVDAAGRIQAGSPEPYTEGTLTAEMRLPERRLTLYTRFGDWFPQLCLAGAAVALAGGAIGAIHRRSRRSSADPAPHP